METNRSGQILGAYTNGPMGAISKRNATNDYGYLMKDALGTVRNLVDAEKDIKMSYKYDIFGAIREAIGSDPIGIPQTFTGKELDTDSGLHYFGARYYDSALGRFITADSWTWGPDALTESRLSLGISALLIGGSLWVLLSHQYVYCLNNPVNLDDPSGMMVVEVLVAIVMVVGLTLWIVHMYVPGTTATKAIEEGANTPNPISPYLKWMTKDTPPGVRDSNMGLATEALENPCMSAGLIDEWAYLKNLQLMGKWEEWLEYYFTTIAPGLSNYQAGECNPW